MGPAYLTPAPAAAAHPLGKASGAAAIHFICHTNLVDEFRRLYPDALRYEGNRSIVLARAMSRPTRPRSATRSRWR